MSSRVSFMVILIQKLPGHLSDLRKRAIVIFKLFPIVLEINFHNFRLVMIGCVMEHSVFVGISDRSQLQG